MNPTITVPLVKVGMPPRDDLMPELERVLYSGMVAEGEHVYRFEDRFASEFGLKNALAVSSGTAGLHLSLQLAGVRSGDQVVTTAMTAEPTNTVILQAGASPVFADVDPSTGNLSPEAVRDLIGPRTRAILVVHNAGYPSDMDRLRAIADRCGVALIEDCAHALGAQWGGNPVGTFGDFAVFSFQAIKHMTTVDGGVLTLRDPSLLPAARRLRWFGLDKGVPRTEVDITVAGYKYNMHNVAAAIGHAQLGVIQSRLSAHIANGRAFDAALASSSCLHPARIPSGAQPSYWLYTLLSDDSDRVVRSLASIGVAAAKLHRPNHLHSVFAPYRRPLPALETFYRRLVHIPCGWWVGADDRRRIIETLLALEGPG
jgi:perosamine synthetase